MDKGKIAQALLVLLVLLALAWTFVLEPINFDNPSAQLPSLVYTILIPLLLTILAVKGKRVAYLFSALFALSYLVFGASTSMYYLQLPTLENAGIVAIAATVLSLLLFAISFLARKEIASGQVAPTTAPETSKASEKEDNVSEEETEETEATEEEPAEEEEKPASKSRKKQQSSDEDYGYTRE